MVKKSDRSGKETRSSTKANNRNNVAQSGTTLKTHYLNFGEEDQMEILGYRRNKIKQYVTWTFYVITLGLLRLIYHWYPQWKLAATHSTCPLNRAEKVLIVDNYKDRYKSYFVKKVETLTAGRKNVLSKSESIISINGLIFGQNYNDNQPSLTVYLCDGTRKRVSQVRVIRCKKLMYVWDESKNKFIKLSGLDRGVTNAELHTYKGYTKTEQELKKITYGANEIVVPVQDITTILVLEALTPFYMFQVFSLVVWLAEFYYYYTIAIVLMSVVGISSSIIETRKNQKNLKGAVHLAEKVLISRGDGTFEEILTTNLVPGDLIVIPAHGCEMQCDAVLLSGNCIVNESMLTGESVPITKTALPNTNKLYDVKNDSNHTLFSGTQIIQTRYYGNKNVLAVVTRTGYLTSKGQLIRSILYPPPADFKFDQDSYKFIIILAVIAVLSFLYTVFSKFSRAIAPWDTIIKALDVVTIAIPPALPAAMTVGKLYALNRLKKSNIYCINSRVINVSGSVNCVCFDKTGTLTEDGLDVWGVVPIEDNEILKPIKDIANEAKNLKLFQGMLTCHSLTLINEELSGDPLDVKMFEATGWLLEEPPISDTTKYDLLVPTIVKPSAVAAIGNNIECGIIQQYQFSSSLQRMSVIARKLGCEYFDVYCKGAPEMIMSLSKPETIPTGIGERLKEYTEQGYRVIGMGTKKITSGVPFHKISKLLREDIECDLEFIGLMILENKLKPQTGQTIEVLRQAGMKIVMVTGDNILTAMSVARECGIIQPGYEVIDVITNKPTKFEVASIKYQRSLIQNETIVERYRTKDVDLEKVQEPKYYLALTGSTFADIVKYFPNLIPKIVTKGVVFARMSGQQKQHLIEELQNLGYYVAMCGDGANDCGALKAAHVGISLSEAESSVASPFTSKESNISCVTKVVQEGRAALVTSFGVFKLMLCYSLTELASVLLLYAIDSNLTSLQFLFIDICLVLNFASFFGKTKAHHHLHKNPPMTSLLGFVPLASIISFMVIVIGFQVISFYFIQTYSWFQPFVFDPTNTIFYSSYENYAVFTISMFQYIIMAVVFSKGKPYRNAIYTNYLYLISILVMIAICSYITLDASEWIQDALELKMPPFFDARGAILVMAVINFIVCLFFENFIVDYVLRKLIKPLLIRGVKYEYLKVENELSLDLSWPTSAKSDVNVDHYKRGIENRGFNKLETTRF